MIQDIQIDVVRQRLYLDDNVTYGRAITYGSGSTMRDMRTTILRHRIGTGIKYPAIVWVGGGGWVTQDFNAHLAELVGFAEGGYVVALIEYRLAGECKFPAQLIDIKAAIRYLRAHAEELNIDADRIGVLGESAGAHLAALIGTTGETREFDQGEHLDQSSAVQAACCWYTPVDFKLMTEQLMAKDRENGVVHEEPIPPSVVSILLGGDPLKNPELVARANPLTYASEKNTTVLSFARHEGSCRAHCTERNAAQRAGSQRRSRVVVPHTGRPAREHPFLSAQDQRDCAQVL